MSLSRCGRLARFSLAGARPVVAAPRAFVARAVPLVRGVSSSSRDAQHKVRIVSMGDWNTN
jgi:glycine hydroxymethyltransferase